MPENMTCCDVAGGRRYPHFSWVDTETVLESAELGEALEGIRYAPRYDENGNICGVEFTGEKYGDEKIFFNALASYVEPGSYLCFKGEDGDAWKWVFSGGKASLEPMER